MTTQQNDIGQKIYQLTEQELVKLVQSKGVATLDAKTAVSKVATGTTVGVASSLASVGTFALISWLHASGYLTSYPESLIPVIEVVVSGLVGALVLILKQSIIVGVQKLNDKALAAGVSEATLTAIETKALALAEKLLTSESKKGASNG